MATGSALLCLNDLRKLRTVPFNQVLYNKLPKYSNSCSHNLFLSYLPPHPPNHNRSNGEKATDISKCQMHPEVRLGRRKCGEAYSLPVEIEHGIVVPHKSVQRSGQFPASQTKPNGVKMEVKTNLSPNNQTLSPRPIFCAAMAPTHLLDPASVLPRLKL